MHTTEPLTPTASGPSTLGDQVADVLPVVDTVFVAGPPVLLAWTGTVLFALMLAGPFALVATLVLVLVAAAAVVALAGAILATPYLLIRHFRLRLAKRRHATEGTGPIGAVIARTWTATKRLGAGCQASCASPRDVPVGRAR